MKNKVVVIIAILLIIAIAVVAGIIGVSLINKGKEKEEEKETEISWGKEYTEYLKDSEDDVQIGLIDLNFDEIPELLVKTKENLFKILSFDKENKKVEVVIEDEEIENLELLYNDETKNYCYGYTTPKSEEKINIISEDMKEIEKVDTKAEEYQTQYITIVEDLQENVSEEKIDTTDEKELEKAIETAKTEYKTTEKHVEEAGIDVEEEIERIKKEASEKLSQEEALKIGQELYDYGTYPAEYEFDAQGSRMYMGKSKTLVTHDDEITVDEVFVGYPYKNSSDVEDYFSATFLATHTKSAPYGLRKIDGTWYMLQAPVGGDPTFITTTLRVETITTNSITFTATTYYSEEFQKIYEEYSKGYDSSKEYDKIQKKLKDNIGDIVEKYKTEGKSNSFIIIKEDGKWKIDSMQVMT